VTSGGSPGRWRGDRTRAASDPGPTPEYSRRPGWPMWCGAAAPRLGVSCRPEDRDPSAAARGKRTSTVRQGVAALGALLAKRSGKADVLLRQLLPARAKPASERLGNRSRGCGRGQHPRLIFARISRPGYSTARSRRRRDTTSNYLRRRRAPRRSVIGTGAADFRR